MEATEFRLGNRYMAYSGEEEKVDLDFFDLLNNEVDLDEIIKSPIKITEEELLRYGWTKINNYRYRKEHKSLTYEYVINEGAFGIFNWGATTYFAHNVHTIHRLQNIWLDLTEEEMKKVE